MNFELSKSYIVDVAEKGIIPLMEFDRSQWFNKDHDDLDFLTNEEKTVIVNDTLGKIRAEIDRQEKWLLQAGYTAYNVDIAFDAIKAVVK